MKHDISLIHSILEQVENGKNPWLVSGDQTHSLQAIEPHVRLLIEHRLIHCARDAEKTIHTLTHEGARFLRAIRDENTREKILRRMEDYGEKATLEVLIEIVKDALMEML